MLEFSFEIIDETKINIQYRYGSEMFNFNLFWTQGGWTLHPFDGILIENRDMCRLIVSELLKNKDFHVMLAKEKIMLSQLRTTINLDQPDAYEDRLSDRRLGDRYDEDDELMQYIENHTFDEVLQLELEQIRSRVDFFQQIIQRMFMEGIGPEDADFAKVQALIRIYKETGEKFERMNGYDPGYGDHDRRRW